ncbi:MAG: TIGR03790 family protein, partial [Verrucomicrobia bacterium]
REAIRRDWLLASVSEARDLIGRLRVVCAGHRLDAIVVCLGVPLRIAHDPTLYFENSNPLAANKNLRTNGGAVDSELSLLASGNYPTAALIPNPLFQKRSPNSTLLDQIIPVGRLDGPTLDDAKGLVDRAILAEREGITGRAYLDIGGPHPKGDQWIEACLPILEGLHFETVLDRASETMPVWARFDAPAFYIGWYANDANGPFTAPDFRFPVGAIALHIHSFSGVTLRSTTTAWAGPLVAKGVTATFGNVGEPFLEFTHQPHLFLEALSRGEPLGRAALFSLNALSWQAILIGDPLYRPFTVSPGAQWENRAAAPAEVQLYRRIRRMRQLAAEGSAPDAVALGMAGMTKRPSLALALTLSELQEKIRDTDNARRTLGVFTALRRYKDADFPFVYVATQRARALGDNANALTLFGRLLDDRDLPRDFRLRILLEAATLARDNGDHQRAAAWANEYAQLTAPPPPPPAPPASP